MFFKLVFRNSKRNQKENHLFFSSLIISIIAFYIILSLPKQDIMIFLREMESDAVNKLWSMIPVFFGMTLFILFFLIYYTGKFEMERRKHEFGVYLMLGMSRIKLLSLLLLEDFQNSIFSLLLGIPFAILLSELISLISAKLIGLGIVGHQISFSFSAVLWTVFGFLLVKFLAFLILSIKISRQEIASLLMENPKGAKKQFPSYIYQLSFILGIVSLIVSYTMAIQGEAWSNIKEMAITISLGLLGTFSLFFGLRYFISLFVKIKRKNQKLHIFNFRQIQETVIYHSNTLAICSLLILAALSCFGAGIGISRFYSRNEAHILDYTFQNKENDFQQLQQTLTANDLDTLFSKLFEMKIGHISTSDDHYNVFKMDNVLSSLREKNASEDRDVLLNNLQYASYPYVISLSSYNQLLEAAKLPLLKLNKGEAAVYIDKNFTNYERTQLLNEILKTKPEVFIKEEAYYLTGNLQTTNLVTDRSITLSFALIVTDETFEALTQGKYNTYFNGILKESQIEKTSLMSLISNINHTLDKTEISYESYLQNMGRQLFYITAASYITIYLAIIFFIVANTMIGIQFLISQRKSAHRYQTLVHLGALYPSIQKSARKQINWYFGIPTVIASISSLFAVQALFTGILSDSAKGNLSEIMSISIPMIFVLCVIECIYIMIVKRISDHYLLTLMMPEREE